MFKVSQSKVKTWRRCRHAYHLRYVEKLARKRKTRPLYFGSLVHQMIEADLNGDNPFELLNAVDVEAMKLFASEKQEYQEILDDVKIIMTEYFQYWSEAKMTIIRKKGRSAEHKFEIEIMPDVIWEGKLDAIGKDKGLRWLVEHKTFNRRPNADARWRNLQSVSYFRAIEMLGWKPVDGTCWDYIWSKSPLKPKLLSSGALSQATIDTLPAQVLKTAKELGLEDDSVAQAAKKAESKRSEWFSRVFTPVDSAVARVIWEDFLDTIKEMVEFHGKKKDRNIEQHCSWCDYEPLCRATLQGLDVDYVKEREYETRKKDDEEDDSVHRVEFEG